MTFPLKWYFILVLKIFCYAYHGLGPSERYGIPKRKGFSIFMQILQQNNQIKGNTRKAFCNFPLWWKTISVQQMPKIVCTEGLWSVWKNCEWYEFTFENAQKEVENERKVPNMQKQYSFQGNNTMSEHMAKHALKKRFQCEHCEKYFSTKKMLKGHNRIHMILIANGAWNQISQY